MMILKIRTGQRTPSSSCWHRLYLINPLSPPPSLKASPPSLKTLSSPPFHLKQPPPLLPTPKKAPPTTL
ncbi:hypothetical protein RCL_jg6231.t1 [Rhizophagus clarus]|uniref:Uncharacterized protein n=1 Tax=Rhizophagus clarus TaxID=94130 RepID=A0A8H3L5G6_9GLOM|nr:hypothetical protein RCL_jg6231.t1 [Rhizophagus clarus]